MMFVYCAPRPCSDSVHVFSLIDDDRDENRLFLEFEFDIFSNLAGGVWRSVETYERFTFKKAYVYTIFVGLKTFLMFDFRVNLLLQLVRSTWKSLSVVGIALYLGGRILISERLNF